jgi:hypothetical protein
MVLQLFNDAVSTAGVIEHQVNTKYDVNCKSITM